jgi:hypothetical protein
MKRIHFFGLVALLILLNAGCQGQQKNFKQKDKKTPTGKYYAKVEDNTFYGKIIATVYQTNDTTIINSGDPIAGGLIGGGLGYLLLGPLGLVVGGVAGIISESGVEIDYQEINKLIIISIDSKKDTSYFNILDNIPDYRLNNNQRQIARSSNINSLHLSMAAKPGQIIIIPSSRPLNKLENINSRFLYFEGEIIPKIPIDHKEIEKLKKF